MTESISQTNAILIRIQNVTESTPWVQQLSPGCCGGDRSVWRLRQYFSDFPLLGKQKLHFIFCFLQPDINLELPWVQPWVMTTILTPLKSESVKVSVNQLPSVFILAAVSWIKSEKFHSTAGQQSDDTQSEISTHVESSLNHFVSLLSYLSFFPRIHYLSHQTVEFKIAEDSVNYKVFRWSKAHSFLWAKERYLLFQEVDIIYIYRYKFCWKVNLTVDAEDAGLQIFKGLAGWLGNWLPNKHVWAVSRGGGGRLKLLNFSH